MNTPWSFERARFSVEVKWLEFKAKHDEPGKAPCPFCGIHHTPAKAHPHCDMVVRFKASIGDFN